MKRWPALIAAALVTACGSGDPQPPNGPASLAPLSDSPGYGVILSDYSSSALAVLDGDGKILDEAWLHSGTTLPGLVATLSGDVVLPTTQLAGSLMLIDRLRTDVVTRIEVPSGVIIGQVRTHDGDGQSAGWSSNPNDVAIISDTSAWVSRYAHNMDEMATAANAGTDLIEINPTTMQRTGDRIDLSSLDTTAIAMTDAGPITEPVPARPNRIVGVGDTLIVGLDRLGVSFQSSGEGMVAVVDLTSRQVTGLALADLAGCGRLMPVPGDASLVAVTCIGFSQPYGEVAQLRASSGIAMLRVSGATVTIERLWRTSSGMNSAISVQNMVPLSATEVLAVKFGSIGSDHDSLFVVDLDSGTQTLVFDSANAFDIGTPSFDAASGTVFVPDATAGLRKFERAQDGLLKAVGSMPMGQGLGLQPRHVYRL